mmetsp:Transcript_16407/g.45128  ORF Transcript_16407/g.45128 Transcript_16407/m.45128 type:complete len:470 (-) Transcript_16407:33-1442(-)
MPSHNVNSKKQDMLQLCAYIRGASRKKATTVPIQKLHLGRTPYHSQQVLECFPHLLQALSEARRPESAQDGTVDATSCCGGVNKKKTRNTDECAIEAVTVGESVVRDLSQEQVGELIEHLGFLPRLSHLEIAEVAATRQQQQRRVHSLHLATLLQRCRTLENLIVWPLVPISHRSMGPLTAGLQGHPHLHSLHLVNLVTPGLGSFHYDAEFDLTRLIQALATVPKLRYLQLAPGFSLEHHTGLLSQPSSALALKQLVQNAVELKSIALRNVGLTLEHVDCLIAGLKTKPGAAAGVSLQDDDNRRPAALQHLDLRYNSRFRVDQAYQRFANFLVNAHESMSSLQFLDLDDDDNHHNISATAAAVVQQLHRRNNRPPSAKSLVQFHLRLNRVGRHMFLYNEQASYHDRVRVLLACNNNQSSGGGGGGIFLDDDEEASLYQQLDLLYYLLQHNPSFLSQAAARRGSTPVSLN